MKYLYIYIYNNALENHAFGYMCTSQVLLCRCWAPPTHTVCQRDLLPVVMASAPDVGTLFEKYMWNTSEPSHFEKYITALATGVDLETPAETQPAALSELSALGLQPVEPLQQETLYYFLSLSLSLSPSLFLSLSLSIYIYKSV